MASTQTPWPPALPRMRGTVSASPVSAPSSASPFRWFASAKRRQLGAPCFAGPPCNSDLEESILPSRRERSRFSRVSRGLSPVRPRRQSANFSAVPGPEFLAAEGDEDFFSLPPQHCDTSFSPAAVPAASCEFSPQDPVGSAVLDVINQAAQKAVQQALVDRHVAWKKSGGKDGEEGLEPITEATVRIRRSNIGLRPRKGPAGANNCVFTFPPVTCRFAIGDNPDGSDGRPAIRHVETKVCAEEDEAEAEVKAECGGADADDRHSSASTTCPDTPAPSHDSRESSWPRSLPQVPSGFPAYPVPALWGPLPPAGPPLGPAALATPGAPPQAPLPGFRGIPSSRFRALCEQADAPHQETLPLGRERAWRSPRGRRSTSARGRSEGGHAGGFLAHDDAAETDENEGEEAYEASKKTSTAEKLELQKLLKGLVKLWSTKKHYDSLVARLREWARWRYLESGELPNQIQVMTEMPGVRTQCCRLRAAAKQQSKVLREQMRSVLRFDADDVLSFDSDGEEEEADSRTAATNVKPNKRSERKAKEGEACLKIGEKLDRISHLLNSIEGVLPANDSGEDLTEWLVGQGPQGGAFTLSRLVGTFRQVRGVQQQLAAVLAAQGRRISVQQLLGDDGGSEDMKAEGAQQQPEEKANASPEDQSPAKAFTPLLRKKLRDVAAQRDLLETRLARVVARQKSQQELLAALAKDNEKQLSELVGLRGGSHRVFGCLYAPSGIPLEHKEEEESSYQPSTLAPPGRDADLSCFERLDAQVAKVLARFALAPPADARLEEGLEVEDAEMARACMQSFVSRSAISCSSLGTGAAPTNSMGEKRKRMNAAIEFDRVFAEASHTGYLFHGFADLVRSSLEQGLNFALFAVGSRTPEKTKLLFGRPPSSGPPPPPGACEAAEALGLAQFLARFLFDELARVCLSLPDGVGVSRRESRAALRFPSRKGERTAERDDTFPCFSVELSALEINGAKMRDCLAGDRRLTKKLEIRQDVRTGEIKILNLTHRAAASSASLLQTLGEVASLYTSLHASSSLVVFLHTEVLDPVSGEVRRGKTVFADVPGVTGLPPQLPFDATGRLAPAEKLSALSHSGDEPQLQQTLWALKELFSASRRKTSRLCSGCRAAASSGASRMSSFSALAGTSREFGGAKSSQKAWREIEEQNAERQLAHSSRLTQVLADCLHPSLSRGLLLFCLPSPHDNADA
ncbi:hypothetical protein BESB_013550 [Besnoitia besnoiti]|uniref:Kinesin motor domain-containing protein n=1 Tax=Besnoitia besnoiti TaxID=94643 RepID=A0A2A9MAM6_BESBE|nr:hypothetical protein BESB_013550 [Besnoitia besnoiti]PFH32743.1 hypothetical protein BESB_013550 [Besnoitia besnoiti]